MTENIDHQEVNKFAELADEWWNKNGDFKPLHVINPLRANYIKEKFCLLYTSPSPRDMTGSRMPSSA